MMNAVSIIGRLTRDPELRKTQSGISVARFSIAVDRDYKSDAGEREADFFDVTAWRAAAEFLNKYFSKGSMIAVQGRLQLNHWTDRDGASRRSVEILAENLYFVGSKASRTADDSAASAPAFADADADDVLDLPF